MQVELPRVTPETGSVDLVRSGCFVLPAGAVVTADLVGEDDAPVVGAIVEAWRIDGREPLRLAQGTSDDIGHVVLVLPNTE